MSEEKTARSLEQSPEQAYMHARGITNVTPDAEAQLKEVFLRCLEIMCDPAHPWDPRGRTWQKGGIFGVLTDAKKKWERFWERIWTHGRRHDDSGWDLINFVGFVMRSNPDSGWGSWGPPGDPDGSS